MVNDSYLPERGDIVWLDFSPQSGREQRGRRPAIVISPKAYNKKTSLALFCPITSQIKGYPFEVELKATMITKGAVISDQVKSLDWKQRNTEFIEKATPGIIHDVLRKINLLVN